MSWIAVEICATRANPFPIQPFKLMVVIHIPPPCLVKPVITHSLGATGAIGSFILSPLDHKSVRRG